MLGRKKDSADAQTLVAYALKSGAIELVPEGRRLKSGRISPYFFNSGLFTDGDSISYLGASYAATIAQSGVEYDVIFGPAYKGIPLVTSTAINLASKGYPSHFAFNRKEAKDHGEGGIIVGASLQGKRVIIIDDVITDGEAKREAKRIIEANGGTVVAIVIAFDRQERGQGELTALDEFQQTFGSPVLAAATLDDLIEVLKNTADECALHKAILPKVLAYIEEYGPFIYKR